MKRRIRIIALILAFSLVMTVTAAAESTIVPDDSKSTLYITSMTVTLTAQSYGIMKVTYSVNAAYVIDRIGALQVRVYESNGTLAKIFSSIDYPSLTSTNTSHHSGSILYGGIPGKSYYAMVVFTAEDNGLSEVMTSSTGTKLCIM